MGQTSTADAPKPASPVVSEEMPDHPQYAEGSIGFLRVERMQTGAVVVDGPATDRETVIHLHPDETVSVVIVPQQEAGCAIDSIE